MNRRILLAAMPAALIAGPAAALCVLDPAETPVMRLFREWQTEFQRVEHATGMSSEDYQTEDLKVHALVARMVATRAENARDVCAKLTAFTFDGEHFADDDGTLSRTILAEARALVA